jgi:hypothetical protein
VSIDLNGRPTPTKSFKYFNYWAWQRVADLLPLDYFTVMAPNTIHPENNRQSPKDIMPNPPLAAKTDTTEKAAATPLIATK